MSNLEVFFSLVIAIGLIAIGLILRHDARKKISRRS